MKKLILLSISVFLGLQLATNSSAKAQNFHIVASFGSTQNWGVPSAILYEVDYFYPYHRFVHVNRFARGRRIFFNVLLEHQGNFVELTFAGGGNIINTNYFNNYPLVSHVCSAYCGYHSDYYFQQQVVCNTHFHGGHNHVNYYKQPNYSRYSRPNSIRVVDSRPYRGHNHGYRQRNGNTRGQYQYKNINRSYSDRADSRNTSNTKANSKSIERNENANRVAASTSRSGNNSTSVKSRTSSNSRSNTINTRSNSSSRNATSSSRSRD